MVHKGKLIVFLISSMVVLYGISAAFYGRVVAKDEAYRELSVFIDAFKKINDDYVEAPDLNKVKEGAMRGLIEALDPYSSYLSKESIAALDKRQANGNAGVGVVLSKRADMIYVVSAQRSSSADEAGVRSGDYLVAIDGVNIEEKSILEVESLLKGADGSKVKATVFRSARTKPLEIEMTRKSAAPAPVNSRMLDNSVGVLEVASLGRSAIDQVRPKLKTLISAGAQKLILDLRDCAEGSVSDGAELANLFLREGVLYYSRNRQGDKVEEVKANAEKFVTNLPLAILLNGSTAGAAEVVVGALKDHERATLVGEKSFGMGSSQMRLPLQSGAVLILSTARIFTPRGKMIQDENLRQAGIKPDVQAPDDERHQELLVDAYYDEQDDAMKYKKLRERISKEQFDKALEVLSKGQITTKRAA